MLADSLQLDHDACGNLDSMIVPCCGELRELKGGHYHKIVEITENAGKCLLSEYAVRISKYHLNIGKKLPLLLHTYWLWRGGSYNCLYPFLLVLLGGKKKRDEDLYLKKPPKSHFRQLIVIFDQMMSFSLSHWTRTYML